MKTQSLVMMSITAVLGLVFIGVAGHVHADSWAIDADRTIVLVNVDAQGKVQFEEAFVDNYVISKDNVKVDRPDQTGGRILATTNSGENIYMIYDLENSVIKAKIWGESGVERIIVQGDNFRII